MTSSKSNSYFTPNRMSAILRYAFYSSVMCGIGCGAAQFSKEVAKFGAREEKKQTFAADSVHIVEPASKRLSYHAVPEPR
jgi:hypothetical protein